MQSIKSVQTFLFSAVAQFGFNLLKLPSSALITPSHNHRAAWWIIDELSPPLCVSFHLSVFVVSLVGYSGAVTTRPPSPTSCPLSTCYRLHVDDCQRGKTNGNTGAAAGKTKTKTLQHQRRLFRVFICWKWSQEMADVWCRGVSSEVLLMKWDQ